MKKKLTIFLLLTAIIAVASLSVTASATTITGEGEISLGNDVNPEDLIDITVPVENFLWLATHSGGGIISSANYQITNNSSYVDLEVTLESFIQTNANTVPISASDLTLNLTGNLSQPPIGDNIVGYNGSLGPYTNALGAGETWIFGFGGNFTGRFTAATINPTYEMVLRFAVK